MKRVSFIWLLKLLKRMTALNLSGQRTMKDRQMLTEFRLKRKAISEYIMHTEKINCGLSNKEHIKHQEKYEAKCFPLLPSLKYIYTIELLQISVPDSQLWCP